MFGLFILCLLWAVSLGFLEEFSLFPNKTIGYKIPLWGKILESVLLHKEKAVVKPLSLEMVQAFSWSCWIWRQPPPLWSQKKWKQWSRTKMKRNLQRPLPERRNRGQGSGYQKRKDLCLLIYSLLGRAGSLLRWCSFLTRANCGINKWKFCFPKICVSKELNVSLKFLWVAALIIWCRDQATRT